MPWESILFIHHIGLPWCLSGKDSFSQSRIWALIPIPWRRKWQPTPVFLPGKSHGQRILAGYSPRGYKRIGHGLTTTKDNSNFIFLALWHWLKYPIQDVWREVNSGPFYLVCNLKEKDFSFPFSLFFCGNDLSDWESLPLSCFTNSF